MPSQKENSTGYRWLVRDGVTSQVMTSLHSGAFLVAFILLLGGTNFHVGLMASFPFLTQLLQLPSICLVDRIGQRKLISFLGAALARLLWIPLMALPLVLAGSEALKWAVVVFFLSSCLAAVSNCGWSSWTRDTLPSEKQGRLMSNRMRLQLGAAMAASLAAGYLLTYWKRVFPAFELHGYLLVFLVGTVLGLAGAYSLARIPEPVTPPPAEPFSLRKILAKALQDDNFRRLLHFLAAWSFAINLAAPFFAVYMLRRLGLPISWVVVMTVISTLSNMLALNLWGGISDRFSNKSVLAVSGPLFFLGILAWPFAAIPETLILTPVLLILIHVALGVSMAGVTLASSNIALKLAPEGEATGYLAVNAMTASLFSGVAALLGGGLAYLFASRELYLMLGYFESGSAREVSFPLLNLRGLDFLFFSAVLIGLYATHRLALVREEGEVEEPIVVRELLAEGMRGAGHLTTVGGPVRLTGFPFGRLIRFFNDFPER
ncbi:MAG: MFS transporter [Nitrospinota bacterium]